MQPRHTGQCVTVVDKRLIQHDPYPPTLSRLEEIIQFLKITRPACRTVRMTDEDGINRAWAAPLALHTMHDPLERGPVLVVPTGQHHLISTARMSNGSRIFSIRWTDDHR